MHPDLATRRRVLLVTYHRYLEADQAWTIAQREVKTWFPMANRPQLLAIGNPGSAIRRLYEQRARTIQQLEVARMKLEVSKQRLAERLRPAKPAPRRNIALIGS